MRGRTKIPFFPFLFLLSWLSYRYFFLGGKEGFGIWSLESGVWGLGSGVWGRGGGRLGCESSVCTFAEDIWIFFLYCILKLV